MRRLLTRGATLESHFEQPVGGADTETVADGGRRREPVLARLAYRDSACRHLTATAGSCPAEPGEVMISTRSAADLGVEVGDTVRIRGEDVADVADPERRFTVAGLYTPDDPTDQYWGRGGFFAAGPPDSDSSLPRVDAVFVADEEDLTLPGRPAVGLPGLPAAHRRRSDSTTWPGSAPTWPASRPASTGRSSS